VFLLKFRLGAGKYSPIYSEFILSCIILALEYIHSCNIIHRDLKPENIVFEENGYARLTDFGVARTRKPDNLDETSGTPGYMAPEVICRMNHSFEADFFALGVITYELIFGTVTPSLLSVPISVVPVSRSVRRY
jgi:serine/threonine protein kinase